MTFDDLFNDEPKDNREFVQWTMVKFRSIMPHVTKADMERNEQVVSTILTVFRMTGDTPIEAAKRLAKIWRNAASRFLSR